MAQQSPVNQNPPVGNGSVRPFSRFERIVYRLACVDLDRIDRAHPDRFRYLTLGVTVLIPAILAVFAGSYTLMGPLRVDPVFAVPIALLWGGMILASDRWLVASVDHNSGRWTKAGIFTSRLCLTLVLGLIIAEPLVLYTFRDRIAQERVVMHQAAIGQHLAFLNKSPTYNVLPVLEQRQTSLQDKLASGGDDDVAVAADPQVKNLQDRLDTLNKQLDAATQLTTCEWSGKCGTGRVGQGPVYAADKAREEELRAERDQVAAQLDSTRAAVRGRLAQTATRNRSSLHQQLARVTKRIDTLTAQRDADMNTFTKNTLNANGLLASMEALSRLGDEHPTMRAAQWAFRAFLWVLDSLVVIITMLMALGPKTLYERLRDDDEYVIDVDSALAIESYEESARIEHETQLDTAREIANIRREADVQAARDDVALERDLQNIVREEVRTRTEADIHANLDDYLET